LLLVIIQVLGGCAWMAADNPAPTPVAVEEPAPPPTQRKNILLITMDTTRADHFATLGYPRVTAPNLEALAARSLVFEQAYAPSPVTLPSHVSILTGTAPTEHGVLTNVLRGGERFIPSEKLTSFAVYAQEVGYNTAGFISGAPVRARMGTGSGFAHWNEMAEREKERRAEGTVDAFLAWWKDREAGPFFAFVHFYDPHTPYRAPSDYRVRFSDVSDLKAWARERNVAARSRLGRGSGALISSRKAINEYDREIHYMDSQIKRIFDALSETGAFEQTIIVVTADHGEGLGQHEAAGHGGLVWNEQLHVPLFIYSAEQAPRRIKERIWTPDIFPTVLGMIDLPREESWLAQVSGGDALAGKGATVFAECVEGRRALIQEQWKYHRWKDGEELLFDLEADPHELKDQAGAELEVLAAMRAAFDEREASQKARAEQFGSGQREMLPEEELQLLRELGYLDDAHIPER
jgi:arylsulfatase A-like enzyme